MQVRKNALVVGDSFHSLVESYLLLREVGFKVCWTYNQMQATQLSLKFQKKPIGLPISLATNQKNASRILISKLQGVPKEVWDSTKCDRIPTGEKP